MKSFGVRLPDEVVVKLDNIAALEDRDRSYIINKAIKDYIQHHEYIIEQINAGLEDIRNGEFYEEKEFKELLENRYSLKLDK
ncbi:Ribbon-helix-helix protein, CopG family [Candidatus Hepatincolaceae symbiont of Richtersius coronifer]